jgi:hypothetical protein
LQWLLHVSAKQCHPQEATIYLSERKKGKQSLPEDGIILPKHVGATVKEKKEVVTLTPRTPV